VGDDEERGIAQGLIRMKDETEVSPRCFARDTVSFRRRRNLVPGGGCPRFLASLGMTPFPDRALEMTRTRGDRDKEVPTW
jgi:hypothetical protein